MPTWLRVRDKQTGHEYDVAPNSAAIRSGAVEVLADYPKNSGLTARPRPAKHRTTKAGRPARKQQAAQPADANQNEEHTNGSA